ncbi:hypothetical protein PtB15_15B226 [Puccinia triticina]|nr:hypothetical protein PtB15_15B226 [Puccinia triticina]
MRMSRRASEGERRGKLLLVVREAAHQNASSLDAGVGPSCSDAGAEVADQAISYHHSHHYGRL